MTAGPGSVHALVVAKAPVPGLAKTRLGERVGHAAAADVAAAALLDTLDACIAAFPGRCHLALAGDLTRARRGEEIHEALRGWHVFAQSGGSLGERLAHAHGAAGAAASAPVLQVGMDTPQVTASMLSEAAALLNPGAGVIGPAVDGGWWLLGLHDPAAAESLTDVVTSTRRTGFDTRRALIGWGVRLATTRTLHDVDTVQDAEMVATAAPESRFARTWASVGRAVA